MSCKMYKRSGLVWRGNSAGKDNDKATKPDTNAANLSLNDRQAH